MIHKNFMFKNIYFIPYNHAYSVDFEDTFCKTNSKKRDIQKPKNSRIEQFSNTIFPP